MGQNARHSMRATLVRNAPIFRPRPLCFTKRSQFLACLALWLTSPEPWWLAHTLSWTRMPGLSPARFAKSIFDISTMALVRFAMSNLRRISDTCTLTVVSHIRSSYAICLFCKPRWINSRTRNCCGVRSCRRFRNSSSRSLDRSGSALCR